MLLVDVFRNENTWDCSVLDDYIVIYDKPLDLFASGVEIVIPIDAYRFGISTQGAPVRIQGKFLLTVRVTRSISLH
jgi:hypothetical protein